MKVGGQFLAMKGAMAQEEADEAASAIRRLGGQIERIAEYTLGDAIPVSYPHLDVYKRQRLSRSCLRFFSGHGGTQHQRVN